MHTSGDLPPIEFHRDSSQIQLQDDMQEFVQTKI